MQADSRVHLRQLLAVQSEDAVFTTAHTLTPPGDSPPHPTLSR